MEKEKIFDLLKYRIFSYYDDARKIKNGIMPRPRVAVYHPTYVCNHNCPGCDFRKENTSIRKSISREKAKIVIDQIIDFKIEGVEFAGGGEPLLHPFIREDVLALHKAGIAVSLITNGSLLSGKTLEAFIKYASYIRISLEAGSKEVFNRVKGIDSKNEFYKIVENITDAVALRKKLKKKLDISVKFTVGQDNYMDMENAVLLASKLGVDSIQFKLYENVDNIELHEEGSHFLSNGLDDVKRRLEVIKNTYKDKIMILGNLQKTQMKGKCWLNPIMTVIDALGDVYLCSYYRHRMNSHKLGNLIMEKFEDIWFSQKHWDIIHKVKKEECNRYDCRFHVYNDLMNEIMAPEKNYLKFI